VPRRSVLPDEAHDLAAGQHDEVGFRPLQPSPCGDRGYMSPGRASVIGSRDSARYVGLVTKPSEQRDQQAPVGKLSNWRADGRTDREAMGDLDGGCPCVTVIRTDPDEGGDDLSRIDEVTQHELAIGQHGQGGVSGVVEAIILDHDRRAPRVAVIQRPLKPDDASIPLAIARRPDVMVVGIAIRYEELAASVDDESGEGVVATIPWVDRYSRTMSYTNDHVGSHRHLQKHVRRSGYTRLRTPHGAAPAQPRLRVVRAAGRGPSLNPTAAGSEHAYTRTCRAMIPPPARSVAASPRSQE